MNSHNRRDPWRNRSDASCQGFMAAKQVRRKLLPPEFPGHHKHDGKLSSNFPTRSESLSPARDHSVCHARQVARHFMLARHFRFFLELKLRARRGSSCCSLTWQSGTCFSGFSYCGCPNLSESVFLSGRRRFRCYDLLLPWIVSGGEIVLSIFGSRPQSTANETANDPQWILPYPSHTTPRRIRKSQPARAFCSGCVPKDAARWCSGYCKLYSGEPSASSGS